MLAGRRMLGLDRALVCVCVCTDARVHVFAGRRMPSFALRCHPLFLRPFLTGLELTSLGWEPVSPSDLCLPP